MVTTLNQPEYETGASELARREPARGQFSILALVNTLLRRRYLVIMLPLFLVALVVLPALRGPRAYTSATSFVPQSSDPMRPGLSGLAAQLGVRVPTSNTGESPAFYAELLNSRAILEDIVDHEYSFEFGGVAYTGNLPTLYKVRAPTPELRREFALRAVRRKVKVSTDRETGLVRFSVTERYAPLTAMIAERLLTLLNDYNLNKRQSQARSERQFVESRLADARAELKAAEDRLQRFLQQNRRFEGSPELAFENERLQREVRTRQEVVVSLAESYEQARIEEVRNIPVLTVVERPVVPLLPDRRGLVRRGIIALVVGTVLGFGLALALEAVQRTRQQDVAEFVQFRTLKRQVLADLTRPFRFGRRRG